MRLQKSPPPTYDGNRERISRYIPVVQPTISSISRLSTRTRSYAEGDDNDNYTYDAVSPNSYDPPSHARLTKTKLRPVDVNALRIVNVEEGGLPVSLMPGGRQRPYTLTDADLDLGADFADQIRAIRARHDRVDSWINHLDSEISLAKTGDTQDLVDLENVLLTTGDDMPTLTRTPAEQRSVLAPVTSVHGSISMASGASERTRTLSRWPGSGSIPIGVGVVEEGGGVVVVEGPWLKSEVLILGLLCLTRAVQMYPYGQALATALSLSDDVDDARWITASYPLTQGAFILIGSRLGMVFGHRLILLIACGWWTAFQVACAFSPNVAALCVLRGITGIGAALTTPNAMALLSLNIGPGRKRDLATALYAAMTPVGTAMACLLSAVLMQLTQAPWSFVVPACTGLVIFGLVWFAVPRDKPSDRAGRIDWIGAYLIVAGLVLFNFVWNQAPAVGWSTPYIYVLLIAAVGHFISFALWEANLAVYPLVPMGVWRLRHFTRTLLISTGSFMSFGIFLWYFSLYGAQIQQDTLIEIGASFQPMTILPVPVAVAAVLIMRRISADHLLPVSNLALVVGCVLVVTTSQDMLYWAMLFPAICLVSTSLALMLPAVQTMVMQNSSEPKLATIANSLISTMLSYGLSTGIGIAATVETQTNDEGRNVLAGYRSALMLAIGLAGAALVAAVMFSGGRQRTKTGGFEHMKESKRKSSPNLMRQVLHIRS